jgi:hypothetical protein
MFTVEDIEARLRSTPFAPFRIVTASGEAYQIDRPDLVILGLRYLIIGIAAKDTRFVDRDARVALTYITAIENLTAPPSTKSDAA